MPRDGALAAAELRGDNAHGLPARQRKVDGCPETSSAD